MVDQDPSHHFRGEAEELRAVLPVNVFLIDQPEVSLVDQGGRLQRVIGKLLTQAINRDSPQFLVNERQHLVERGLVAIAPVDKKLSNTCGRGILHQTLFSTSASLLFESGKAKLARLRC